MSSIRMAVATAIPNKATRFDKFGKKGFCNNASASPTRMRMRLRSLKLTANYPCDQLDSTRRSGMYKPTLWDFDRIQSLNSVYTEEKYKTRASDLVVQVKRFLEEESDPLRQLQLIDDLQRLGLSYHFDHQFDQILNYIYSENLFFKNEEERDLYSTALAFRLLRQHGLKVSQDVFDRFKNEEGGFGQSLGDNAEGVLELYEASFLLTEGEDTLELARVFSTNLLQKKVDDHNEGRGLMDDYLCTLVRHSLEIPLHWSVRRPNARWFIDAYAERSDVNPIVLELAKLDFNIVQADHQEELKEVSRWWKESKMGEKLPFARDRVVENYLWNVGIIFEPRYGHARVMTAKLFVLITVIDDVFDVYGTLEETQLFNDTIVRWDVEAIHKLPEYMQICYLALDSFINEMAYDVLKEHGLLVIQDLRKSWADLCTSYAKEAEWYHTGYTPTLEEYMSNAWISISAHLILTHVFFLITNPIQEEAVVSVRNYHNIIRCSALVLRLADDLGTSPYEMKRGDVPKAVECYMNETGASLEEGREHVKWMLREVWKETNGERFGGESPFAVNFIQSAADLGRQAQFMYLHGDGHGIRNPQIEQRILSLLFHPAL